MLGHRLLRQPLGRHDEQPPTDFERGLERRRQPLLDSRSYDQAVDHDLDRVLPLLVQGRQVPGEFDQFAVDPGAQEAFPDHLFQLAAVLALLAPHVGREQQQAGALRHRGHTVHHLLHGLGADHLAALRAVGNADRGVEQTQVVVNLGHRADRRPGIAGHRLLFDRDGGRQPLDRVDVRLLDLVQELAGVRRQRLDVAALSFGEQRVEGERGLARARHAGDHDQSLARDLDRDVLQVVLPGAPDDDLLAAHGPCSPRSLGPDGSARIRRRPRNTSPASRSRVFSRSRWRLSCNFLPSARASSTLIRFPFR